MRFIPRTLVEKGTLTAHTYGCSKSLTLRNRHRTQACIASSTRSNQQDAAAQHICFSDSYCYGSE